MAVNTTCKCSPQISQPTHSDQGKSVFPHLVSSQAKQMSRRENHPTPAPSKFHCPKSPQTEPSRGRTLLAPPRPAAPQPAQPPPPEGLQPPACSAAASEPRDEFLHVSPSRDSGKMAALTVENFAALQNLLKVNWRGGDSMRRVFVPGLWEGKGRLNGPRFGAVTLPLPL